MFPFENAPLMVVRLLKSTLHYVIDIGHILVLLTLYNEMYHRYMLPQK